MRAYRCSKPDRGGYPDPQEECETGLTGDARPLKGMRDRAYGRPLPVRWGWIGPTFSGLIFLMPMRRDPEMTSPAPYGYPQLAYGPPHPTVRVWIVPCPSGELSGTGVHTTPAPRLPDLTLHAGLNYFLGTKTATEALWNS